MSIRPQKIRPRKRKEEEKETSSVIDLVKEVGSVSEFASELNKLKMEFKKKIDALSQTTDETQEDIQKEFKVLSGIFIRDAEGMLKNKMAEMNQEIERAKLIQKGDKGDSVKGDKGDLPSSNEITALIKNHIPKPVKGDKGDSVKGDKGKDAILDEEDLMNKLIKKIFKKELAIEKIKGLETRLRSIASQTMLGGGGQGSWRQKNLSGTIDGSNTVFTFEGDPFAEFSATIYLNYTAQNPFTDYTISGNTITYTTAPHASLSAFPHIIRGM